LDVRSLNDCDGKKAEKENLGISSNYSNVNPMKKWVKMKLGDYFQSSFIAD